MESDWRLVPDDILCLVLEKLQPSLSEYLRFSAVCKSWQYVAQSERMGRRIITTSSHAKLPLLLVPTKDGSEKKRSLYDVGTNKTLELQVSVPCNWRCAGSSHGWLLFNSRTCFTMLNPFTMKTIILPPVKHDVIEENLNEGEEESFYYFHVKKAVLSCNPSLYPNNYEVVVIYRDTHRLAIFRAGDNDWTIVQEHPRLKLFFDVIHYRGDFYAIDAYMGLGKIIAKTCGKRERKNGGERTQNVENDDFVRLYKLDMVAPRMIPFNGKDFYEKWGGIRFTYLVETTKGDLVFVLRILKEIPCEENENEPFYLTINFKLFKLVNATKNNPQLIKWMEIYSLDDDVLFLGDNHSMAINIGERFGYQKNSIYFTDDRGIFITLYEPHGPCDIGVFNFDKQQLASHYKIDSSQVHMPPTIWVVPSLQGPDIHPSW